MSLFDTTPLSSAAASTQTPLAERMRPRTLDEFVGQEQLLAAGKPLRVAIEHDDLGGRPQQRRCFTSDTSKPNASSTFTAAMPMCGS